MDMSPPSRSATGGPPALASELRGARPDAAPRAGGFVGGRLLRSLGGQLGSQAVLAATGVAALPLLARNLGADRYQHFSLALAVLGLSSQLDLVRPRFVRSFARGERDRAELATLWTVDLALVASVAAVLALVGLGPSAALPVGIGALLFAGASREFALLSARGRVGTAAAVRNLGWAAATVGAVVLSGARPDGWSWLWCFPAANAGILLAYRALLERLGESPRALPGLGFDRAAWRRLASEARDLFGHGLSVLVLGSTDKLLVEGRAPAGVASGPYMGQYDLAVKVHVVSTALGATLYPLLSRACREEGEDAAARRFVRFASRAACAYFAAIAALIVFHEPLVRVVLGADFASAAPLLAWMLPGVFVAHFGFLLTPWQRAKGDFASQRRAYGIGALVMVAAGLALVPTFGAAGAVATYLAGRTTECLLVVGERRRIAPELRPGARLACAAGMTLALFGLAWTTTGGSAL